MRFWLAFSLIALLAPSAAQPGSGTPNKACIGLDIGSQTYVSREVSCLRELRKTVSRKGGVLTVRLENGTSKTYPDNPSDGDNYTRHWLVGYHPEVRVYLIAIGYYEGIGFELLSARTGKVLRLTGTPHFSPDKSRFVAIDNDEAYGGDHDLVVGSVSNDSLSLEWQYRTKDGLLEWRLDRWVDNDHIALQVSRIGADVECPDGGCDAMLVRFDKTWTIRWLPSKRQ
ncbi:MAG TPA: hypothetical protein VNK51_24390 [Bradyrhizobium sp.]|nr:hypothetical protein [Bradyrhizobium sp.]